MIVDLVGVYEDGTVRAPFVPANTRHAMTLIQGESVLLRLSIVRASGVPVDVIGEGWSLVWSAKKVRNGCQFRRLGSPNVLEGPHRVDFLLTAEETKALKTGKYAYDIFMIGLGGAQEAVVPYSEMQVEPSLYPLITAPITPSPTLPIVVPSAAAVYLEGFSTGSVTSGRMVYAPSNYVTAHTDAAALPAAGAIGAYDGTVGKVLALGVAKKLLFSTTSPTPAPSNTVYLARADAEPASAAAGKVTTQAPASGFVVPIGQVVAVDGSYASTREAQVLVFVQSYVKKAS